MRVAQFRQEFSTSSETFIYDLVTEMQRQGVDTHVVTLRRVNEESRPFRNVTVVERPSRWHPRRLWNRALVPFGKQQPHSAEWPQVRQRLEGALRRLEPDVIHAQFGPAGVILGPVAKQLEIPLVVSFHGYDVSVLPRDDFWQREYGELFPKVKVFHAVSTHIAQKLERLGAPTERIHVIHNGINLSSFENPKPLKSKSERHVQCLFVGRLVEKKAPKKLIQSFKKACVQVGNEVELELKIVGDGPRRSETEREVEARNLMNRVSFMGAVPHSKVPALMSESDVYTMHCMTASNGDQEGMGVTFAEASAMKLPIVATRHNGIPDVVLDGETGFLVPEGDVEAMGERIAKLARSPNLRSTFGGAGRNHVEEHFSLRKEVRKMKSIYKSI